MLHPPDLSHFQFSYLLAALAVSSLGSLGATRLQARCAQAAFSAGDRQAVMLLGTAGLGLCTWLAYLFCRLALDVALPLAGNADYYASTLLLCLALSRWTLLRLHPGAGQRRQLFGMELLFAAGCVVCDGVGYALTYPHYAEWKYALVASTISSISGAMLVATRLAFRRQELRGVTTGPLVLAAGSILSGLAAVMLPMLAALALSVAQPLLFAAVTPGLVYMLGFTIVLSGLLVALHLLEASIGRHREAAEEAALREETYYDVLYERNPDAVFRLDLMIRFTHVNLAMTEVSGYSTEELLGKSLIGCISPSEVELTLQQLYQALKGQACSFATALLARSGQTRGMLMTAIPIAPDGKAVGIFVVAKDIHESKKAFHEYRYLTYYDEQTNLHNRRSFLEAIGKRLATANDGSRSCAAVLYMNLDRFGPINALFGHDFGDRLLREASGRLAHCLPLGSLVARIGADEFAVALPDIGSPDDVPKIAGHIVEQFAKPLVVSGSELLVTASVGAARYPADGGDAPTLLAAAQQAMRAAKRDGANRYALSGDSDASDGLGGAECAASVAHSGHDDAGMADSRAGDRLGDAECAASVAHSGHDDAGMADSRAGDRLGGAANGTGNTASKSSGKRERARNAAGQASLAADPTLPITAAELLRALQPASRELTLLYQPRLAGDSSRVVGAEALLRWHHPRRGLLQPAQFLPLAETTGLALQLDAWVLQEASRQLAAWRGAGLPAVPLAVNLSPRHLLHAELTRRVAAALQPYNDAPAALELELAESALAAAGGHTLERLHALKQLGVRIGIDGFGTAGLSLASLRTYPIDRLNVSRSLLAAGAAAAGQQPSPLPLLLAVARELGADATAVGVETTAEAALLRELGFDALQGCALQPPLAAEEFGRQLAAQHVSAAP